MNSKKMKQEAKKGNDKTQIHTHTHVKRGNEQRNTQLVDATSSTSRIAGNMINC